MSHRLLQRGGEYAEVGDWALDGATCQKGAAGCWSPPHHTTPSHGDSSVTTEMLNPQNNAGVSGLEARLKALKLGLGNG